LFWYQQPVLHTEHKGVHPNYENMPSAQAYSSLTMGMFGKGQQVLLKEQTDARRCWQQMTPIY